MCSIQHLAALIAHPNLEDPVRVPGISVLRVAVWGTSPVDECTLVYISIAFHGVTVCCVAGTMWLLFALCIGMFLAIRSHI